MTLFGRGRPQPDPVGSGQESVWDYPRPPRLEPTDELVEVWLGGERIAATTPTARAWRVLETSHPPTYYLPRTAFADGVLRPAAGTSWCEWKGEARYFDLLGGDGEALRAAWRYPDPTAAFTDLADAYAVRPESVERCAVDGETVRPQPGSFYGGWVTDRVAGPFKGEPGSEWW